MPLSRNALLVESWNSYRIAPAYGFQAKEGVRANVSARGSSTRSRNGCSPLGAPATARGAAPAEAVSARTAARRKRARARRVGMRLLAAGCGLGRGGLRRCDHDDLPGH